MAKFKLFIPLACLLGFSLWGVHRGLEAIRTRSYTFTYTVGSRRRPPDFSRSIPFKGAEAVCVGCAMITLGLCGLLWLPAICWPSPPRTIVVHKGLARTAFALYVISILVLMPPWRLWSMPVVVFYGVHAVLFGLWKIFHKIENPDRQKQFIALAALLLMFGRPCLETVAIRFGGAFVGHDTALAASAAFVSALFIAGQLISLNQGSTWGI